MIHIDSKLEDRPFLPTNEQFPGEPRDLHDYAYQTQGTEQLQDRMKAQPPDPSIGGPLL